MAVTGVVLAYEKQILSLASQKYRVASDSARLPLEDLLARISPDQGKLPSAITLRAAAGSPVELAFGRDVIQYINPYNGEWMGESRRLPAFFSTVENLHRWLGTNEAGRAWGKAITGACTLGFAGLTLSGPFLWWPREWTRPNLKKIALFRGGLTGRARYWNWHNVLGVWCALPLFVIALTGVIMSYAWANNLLYRLTGNQPPVANVGATPRSGDRTGGSHAGREGRPIDSASRIPDFRALEILVAYAQKQIPRWQSMQVRMPGGRGPMTVFVDEGSGGRPDQRSQFVLNPQNGEIRWETFSSYNAGRRLRAWVRFSHTGEAGGMPGQTIAALACVSASVLAFTGLALSTKRLLAARSSSAGPSDSPSK